MSDANNAKKGVEIIVHIDDELDETQRKELVETVTADDSVFSAEFCPLRYHLVMVRYDRHKTTSMDILNKVKQKNLCAQLVGPI
jgi:hypothetical protein